MLIGFFFKINKRTTTFNRNPEAYYLCLLSSMPAESLKIWKIKGFISIAAEY